MEYDLKKMRYDWVIGHELETVKIKKNNK